MKPQLYVIGVSRLVYLMPAMRCANGHDEPATPLSRSQKFDYSPQELTAIIEWLALERKAA